LTWVFCAVIMTASWMGGGSQTPAFAASDGAAVQSTSFAASAEKPSWREAATHWAQPMMFKLGLDVELIILYAQWVVGAPALVVAIVIVMLLRPRHGSRQRRTAELPQTVPVAPSAETKPLPRMTPPRPVGKLSDQVQILRFFLQLFKTQQGANPDAPAQIVRVETRPTCPDETYEMRILHNEEWLTRRMSLGLLGQGGGSRSRCFYVIYDTHMVIKIPPASLVRFSDYKRQIAAEGRIVARLAPRLCIVPRVSVILKAVHTFADSEQLPEDRLEEKYARLLETDPEMQEHLKIDHSFAFFMDLAKHYFLSTTLEEIHSGYGRLIEEARQHPELVWDHNGFMARYGEDAGPVCHALQDAYNHCEERLRGLIEEAGLANAVSSYHLRQFFLTHIAGETIRREDHDLPADVIGKINQLLADMTHTHRQPVERYRKQLREYIRRTRFSQYHRQFENLSSSMLSLLAWIRQKGLALRDLKPENLFVAGNPDEYPGFLNDQDKFSLGLIDVETAVAIDADDPILMAQPQLAGTPLYATPTHLMSNAILMEIYDDLSTILHLQDWFATIAILYKIVTGENLFATTAHVFPEILSRLKVVDPAGPDMHADIIHIQRLFWNSATAEFQDGLARRSAAFASIEVAIPQCFVAGMTTALKAEIKELQEIIVKAVADQSFFNSGDKRRFLKEASSERVGQMKNKLVQEAQRDEGQEQGQVLLYFEILEKVKERLESKQLAAANLAASKPAISLDHLLEIMFQQVFSTMYPDTWPELAPKFYGSSALLTTDITTYQATM